MSDLASVSLPSAALTTPPVALDPEHIAPPAVPAVEPARQPLIVRFTEVGKHFRRFGAHLVVGADAVGERARPLVDKNHTEQYDDDGDRREHRPHGGGVSLVELVGQFFPVFIAGISHNDRVYGRAGQARSEANLTKEPVRILAAAADHLP